MLALSLGIAAAFAWAAHDLLVRKLSQGAVLLPMMLAVLAAGGVALLLPALLLAEWSAVGVAGLMAFNVGLYLTFAYTMLEAANAITAGYLISVVATMTGYEGALDQRPFIILSILFLAWLNYRGVLATLTFNLVITAIAFVAILVLFVSTSGIIGTGIV